MASFANMTASIRLNIQDFASNLRSASAMVRSFSSSMSGQLNGGIADAAKKSKFEFKDVARIVQGIAISKVFYSGLNAIRNCTNAVWEFNQELEYAKIAYSNLFGDTELAEEFINVLKDFAATTPFSFKESEAAAKRLLSYGIQYKNVMYVMQGVLSASSMQGNPQAVESVSRALGQIYTKGKLMNEEMRQLAEAGIPAYEILQEKLGLTQKQMQKIGELNIPASKAINALVDGMNERYGGVVAASSKTLKGIVSNIKDNALMILSGAFEPFISMLKSGLNTLGEFLLKVREIFELKGLGGVLEALFPPEMQEVIRMFAANFINLIQAIIRLAAAIGSLLGPALQSLILLFNAFAPVVATVANALAYLINSVTSNATAMRWLTQALTIAAAAWVLFKARAIAAMVVTAVCKAISKALTFMSAVMTLVAAHPLWGVLLMASALLIGVSGGFDKLGESVRSMFKKITAFNGVDPDKILLPSQKERASDLEKFNEALDGTKDGMDELADSTGKATKAAKGLLSFDEVFRLNNPDENKKKDQNDIDFGNIELPELDPVEGMVPEVEEFDPISENFVGNFIESLKDKFMAAGIGAIIGGILGGILGGPLGAKIGAIAGAIAGWFWDDIAEKLGLTDMGKISLPVCTAFGAAIGGIAGGPLGALIGAGIGALVGWLIDSIYRGVEEGDWSNIGYPIGVGIGAAIGGIVGGPPGALVGAAIGALVGWIIDKVVEGGSKGKWDFPGLSAGIGTGIGTAIGAVVGGPPGAFVGAAIGSMIGWATGLIVDGFKTGNWKTDEISLTLATGLGTAIGALAGGPPGAAIGAAIGLAVGWIVNKFMEADWDKVAEAFFKPFKMLEETINDVLEEAWLAIVSAWESRDWLSLGINLVRGILEGIVSAFVFIIGTVASFFEGVWNALCEIFGIHSPATSMYPIGLNIILGILEGFLSGVATLLEGIATVGITIIDTIGSWFVDLGTSVSTWASNATQSVLDFATKTATSISTWCASTATNINTWISARLTSLSNFVTTTISRFSNWATTNINHVKRFVSNAGTNINNFISSALTRFNNFISNSLSRFSTWASGMATRARTAMSSFSSQVSTGLNNVLSIISSFCSSAISKISSWASSFSSWISSTISNAASAVSSFISNAMSSISNVTSRASSTPTRTYGHATGGVFNREHVARFAEGNKAEAIIPLENASAMQPFVDAVSNGLAQTLGPMMVQLGGSSNQELQPLYVGTLIADDKGLKELERKMRIIRIKEERRG